jgi:predicted RNA-binding Zn ribbon-like protein
MERIPINVFSVSADGLRLPAPLGGHPAVDFCNTLAGWDEPEPGDFLRTYDHVAVWAAAWGLIDDDVAAALRERAAGHRSAAGAALESARQLRTSIYRVLTESEPGPHLDLVADSARRAYEASELDLSDGQGRWRLPASAGLRVPQHAIARSATELVTSPDAAAVHRCPGDDCGWLFIDRSGRRRWCTMALCGNRAKARRFAERQRERAGATRRTAPGR